MRPSASLRAAPLRAARRGRLALVSALAAPIAAVVADARPARAQMMGLPVVQSPFAGRAFALALDAGGGGDGLRTLGGALAVRKAASRITGALGVGAVQGFAKGRPSLGVRVAYLLPLGASGSLAAAPFVGFGAVSQGDRDAQLRSTNGRQFLPGTITIIPVGVGVGYRALLGGRTIAVHLAPQAQHWRLGAGGVAGAKATSKTYVRVGAALDATLTRQIGLTVAYEAGASSTVQGMGLTATGLAQGPRRSLVGVALSYTPRRARR